MRIGINLLLWTATPNVSEHGPILEKLKHWGFDAFEIGVGSLSAKEIDRFAKKGDELGLARCALDVYTADEMDIISADVGMRRKAINFLKTCIAKTCDLGATVFSGPMYQGLCNTTQAGPTPDERRYAVEGLRECALYAKEKGVKLAAEPLNRFEMYLVNTVEQAYELCEEVGVDSMGILADTHHSNIEEYDTAASWARVMDKIHSIHISENNRGIPGYGHAIPPSVFDAIKKGGYDGNLIIEAFNANVPGILPLLRLWRPFVENTDDIAIKGLKYIKKHL